MLYILLVTYQESSNIYAKNNKTLHTLQIKDIQTTHRYKQNKIEKIKKITRPKILRKKPNNIYRMNTLYLNKLDMSIRRQNERKKKCQSTNRN